MAEQGTKIRTSYFFLEFFKYFGIILAIAVAFMPMMTRYEDFLPMYAAHKEMLTSYTTSVCLLALGLIFSMRRYISRMVFPLHSRAISATMMLKRRFFRYVVPVMMICISIYSMVAYYSILDNSVKQAAVEFSYSQKHKKTLQSKLDTINESTEDKFYLFRKYGSNDALVTIDLPQNSGKMLDRDKAHYIKFDSEKGYEMVLALTPAIEIPEITKIIFSFVFIYLGSSVAFAWFGLIEYLQKENNLMDRDLLSNPYRIALEHAFRIDDVDAQNDDAAPLYFKFSYDPAQSPPVILEDPTGPYVENYGKRLEYYGPDIDSEFHVWAHQALIEQNGDNIKQAIFTTKLKYDPKGLQDLMYKTAYQELSKIAGSNINKHH
ncbi:hypothetical protein [Kaarinaea lacus]